MNCPRCNAALNLSERQGVEIDFCPACRGVWLDRGELDKIIERYDAYIDDHPGNGRSRPVFREHNQPRRKPFWQELFD